MQGGYSLKVRRKPNQEISSGQAPYQTALYLLAQFHPVPYSLVQIASMDDEDEMSVYRTMLSVLKILPHLDAEAEARMC